MAVVAPKSDNKPQLPARRHSLDIVPGRRTSRSSFTRMRTNDWVLTTDVPSDLVVEAGGLNFSLHKVLTVHFPIFSPMQQLEIHRF
jgi:hypothetical protein